MFILGLIVHLFVEPNVVNTLGAAIFHPHASILATPVFKPVCEEVERHRENESLFSNANGSSSEECEEGIKAIS